eukprot:8373476-Pyramimonas_sp.AAC.1
MHSREAPGGSEYLPRGYEGPHYLPNSLDAPTLSSLLPFWLTALRGGCELSSAFQQTLPFPAFLAVGMGRFTRTISVVFPSCAT